MTVQETQEALQMYKSLLIRELDTILPFKTHKDCIAPELEQHTLFALTLTKSHRKICLILTYYKKYFIFIDRLKGRKFEDES